MKRDQHLVDYYMRGLDGEADRSKFLEVIDEMGHLTNREQISAFAMVYILVPEIPRVVISSAIGYTEKVIQRGLRGSVEVNV